MSDWIRLRNIRACGRHGVSELERQSPQALDIDIEIEVDLAIAGASDQLSDTVDYSHIHNRVVETVEETSFCLIERLGEELLKLLFEDSRIRSSAVTIAKPGLLNGATPSVTLCRNRNSNSKECRTQFDKTLTMQAKKL